MLNESLLVIEISFCRYKERRIESQYIFCVCDEMSIISINIKLSEWIIRLFL